jgi:hypothetical protein
MLLKNARIENILKFYKTLNISTLYYGWELTVEIYNVIIFIYRFELRMNETLTEKIVFR